MTVQVLHGDCLALLPTLPANSIDAIVTDPPAGISFMGREWDKDKGGRDNWIAWMQQVAAECLRCMKPGGHALVWALPRTSHWTATAWENAGWEVRDIVHHLFGTGFPKSLNVSVAIDKHLGAEREIVGRNPTWRESMSHAENTVLSNRGPGQMNITAPATPEAQQWQGWGTALKPAVENWILLRKPLIGTVAQNVLEHGIGGINVDACRVPMPAGDSVPEISRRGDESVHCFGDGLNGGNRTGQVSTTGRWPPNLLHDGSDEVVGCFPQMHHAGNVRTSKMSKGTSMFGIGEFDHNPAYYHGETDQGTARFFPSLPDDERRILYCPKASRKDRAGSKHPTIKPIKLIEWLCKLICPPNGTILDPFAGSGTTGQAAMNLGFDAILIEQSEEYVADIQRRMGQSDGLVTFTR